MPTPVPAAIAQIGDTVEVQPNTHTAGQYREQKVLETVIHVQTYAPAKHPMSPIRDDYVARQVVTRVGSRWAGHPRGGRYVGPEIKGKHPAGVSFEEPWAAPYASHGAMPMWKLVANTPQWGESSGDLGPYTSREEAYRHAQAAANVLDADVALMLDDELVAEFHPE